MAAPHPETADRCIPMLGRKPRAAQRLAVVADADLSMACAVLGAPAAADYAVVGAQHDAATLRAALVAADGEAIVLNDYAAFHATLPARRTSPSCWPCLTPAPRPCAVGA